LGTEFGSQAFFFLGEEAQSMIHAVSSKIGTLLEKIIIPFLMMMVFLLVFFQVVNRFILHLSAPWTEEYARYAFVWLSLLGAAEATRKGDNLNVAFFQNLVKGFWKRAMVVASDLLSIIFFGFLVYHGFSWVIRNGFKVVADTIRLHMFYIQVIVPLASAIIVLFILDGLFTQWRNSENKSESEV
jgi:TRAP-type C4-dicarboxylate transport system permease small subunit